MSVSLPLSSVVMPVRPTNSRMRSTRVPGSTVPRPERRGELAGVRRDDARLAAQQFEAFAQVEEPACVHDERRGRCRRESVRRSRRCGRPVRGRAPARRRRCASKIRAVLRRRPRARGSSSSVDDDLFDEVRAQRGGCGLRRRDGDVARAGARGCARAEHRGARKLRRARDDERRAGGTLSRIRRAPGE